MTRDFNSLGDKITADALSRCCSTCGATIEKPCWGLGQTFHPVRAVLARELLAIANTYIEKLPPPRGAPLPPQRHPDPGVVFLVIAAVVAVGWLIIDVISSG